MNVNNDKSRKTRMNKTTIDFQIKYQHQNITIYINNIEYYKNKKIINNETYNKNKR